MHINRAVATEHGLQMQGVVIDSGIRLDDDESVKQVVDTMTDAIDEITIHLRPHSQSEEHRAVATMHVGVRHRVLPLPCFWLNDVKAVISVIKAFADRSADNGLIGDVHRQCQCHDTVAARDHRLEIQGIVV